MGRSVMLEVIPRAFPGTSRGQMGTALRMKPAGGRVAGLDGLRGIAALVVVIHHALLTQPQLAGVYLGHYPNAGGNWVLTETPAHLLWGGHEAVREFVAGLRCFSLAESLGGVESLIEHRASIEGPGSPCPPDLLRLSVGLEAVDDLIGDLEQAMGAAS